MFSCLLGWFLEWTGSTTMMLTEQVHVDPSTTLSMLCHLAKNLWNAGNWLVRQDLFNLENVLYYEDLDFMLKHDDVYKNLPAQCSQQVLKKLAATWKAFFRATKEYHRNRKKFLGRPRIPGYMPKDGETTLIFTNQQCKIKDGFLHFPPRMTPCVDPVKTRLPDSTDLREIRIVPKGMKYIVEIVYRVGEADLGLNKGNVLGIDIGLDNTVTTVNNVGLPPFVVKGGIAKSINHYYNKEVARYRSALNKQGIFKDSKRIMNLHWKRNNKIKDLFHKISRKIVEYCIENDIGTIVIGYNDGWKQRCNLGRVNNQAFVQVPFSMLLHHLEYKGALAGIDVVKQEESYTSKASFIDGDNVPARDAGKVHAFSGKRVSRGLYRSAGGIVINADVNGAANITRKAVPNVSGIDVFRPVVLPV